MKHYEVSAKENLNIDEVLNDIMEKQPGVDSPN
jgi:translation elongation factor EF-4